MHGDARYVDVLERAIYNGILAGIGLDGRHFFYVNPLASNGDHHRQPFFDCNCCPPNIVRFLSSLSGYVYAIGSDDVYVNLYAAGRAKMALGANTVTILEETRYPWDGEVKLTVQPQKTGEFTIRLRIPDWCAGAKVSVNNVPIERLTPEKGYARVRRRWTSGDTVCLNMPMPIRRIEAHPAVRADAGRVAVQRGPIVYCFEAVDNGGGVKDIVLAADPHFVAEHRNSLLGGVTVITCATRDGRKLTAVPYYAWDNREPGEMAIWVRQDGKLPKHDISDPTWQDKLYRSLDLSTSCVSARPTMVEMATGLTPHCNGIDTTDALNDDIEPREPRNLSIR